MLLFKRDKRVTQVAREAQIPQQTLQRIVAGLSPKPHRKTLNALANYFSLSVEQLTGKEALPEDQGVASLSNIQHRPIYQIPYIDFSDIENYLKTRDKKLIKSQVNTDGELSENVFATRMTDSSMYPYIPKHALVLMDPIAQPEDQHFVLVRLAESGAFIIRQILTEGADQHLKPMNPDLSTLATRTMKKDDKVLALVIEVRQRYGN
ncbi:MAG: LexA family transcriptional regulator [Gammaproteobacteria bacterium]|nr:LexA family transcriptional regulator [Gammaproteobacteria bacterium]